MSTYRLSRKHGKMPSGPQDGVVALEFAILLPVFLLILVGILEFGHLFYVRHTLTNASREGARAAVVFKPGTPPEYPERVAWAQGTAPGSALDTVKNYLNTRLPGVKWTPQVVANGGAPGSTVTVTITATDVSLVLGELVSAFKNLSVSGQTTMKME